jgi:hypothetical protein
MAISVNLKQLSVVDAIQSFATLKPLKCMLVINRWRVKAFVILVSANVKLKLQTIFHRVIVVFNNFGYPLDVVGILQGRQVVGVFNSPGKLKTCTTEVQNVIIVVVVN